jgi:hypothetical protein
MSKTLLSLFLIAPILTGFTGCAAAALGVGAGVLISQEMMDNNIYVGQLNSDVNKVWSSAKTTLSHSSLKPIDVDNEVRTATAEVDGAKVTINVETYDLNRSLLKVTAKKYGVNNGEMAEMMFNKIVGDLEHP